MAKQGGKKFTWVIKNFCLLQSEPRYFRAFEIGAAVCSCRLSAAPHANIPELVSLHMSVHDPSLPPKFRRYVTYRITLVNQFSEKLSITQEGTQWFDSDTMEWGSKSVYFLPKLVDKDGGFLVNDEVKFAVEVDLFEVIDIPEKFGKTVRPPSKIEENNGAVSSVSLKESSTIKESVDVNGFQVSLSRVESVRCIFERHPDIAVGFRSKNQHLRKACMNSLLGLIETLCQSLQELFREDLVEADVALTYLKDSGFKVDWLEKKLEQVKDMKEKELAGSAMLQETEENLLKLKLKCAELDALAEEQKSELSAIRTPLSFDDVVS